MTKKLVTPTSVRIPARFRGFISSKDTNDFREGVVKDIQQLGLGVNALFSSLQVAQTKLTREVDHLRREVDALRNMSLFRERSEGVDGFTSNRFVDLSDTKGVSFPSGSKDIPAAIAAEFGELTLPAKGVENKFYVNSIRSGRVITAPDLAISVSSKFDKGAGDGIVDYEYGGKVDEGIPENAFNGNNTSFWIRRVEFPLSSTVSEVEVEMVVTVPKGSTTEANLIELYPFPNGTVDVTVLATAPAIGGSFTTVPSFSSTNNAVKRRYHMPVTNVEQVKVRLRQRNWVEENGAKVFYYGLQELGLKLVDYDKTNIPGAPFGQNPSLIVRVDAPEGTGFSDIFRIVPSPDFFKEDPGSRHIRMRLSTDSNLSSFLWDSDSSPPPQQSGVSLTPGNAPSLFFAIELRFVETSGGSLSPYTVGTTPYLWGIGLSFNLKEI
ncbi:MAG: hypothetical protein D6698_14305 [Gammaproteobacteria bacterium]|nr:MAG: hypothetical protein D6698_14305 [Gammaproteobacteria bacterium]